MNSEKLLKIGVLMGGMSLEREVSFNSGRTICDHLDTKLYEVIPLFQNENGELYILPWHFLHRGKISDFKNRLEDFMRLKWSNLKNIVDIIYLAVHGKYAEDGSIQAMLEILKIPYTGSSIQTSAIASNKNIHDNFLKINNIKTASSIILNSEKLDEEKLNSFLNTTNFPIIIKPTNEGSSFGVSIINEKKEIKKSIDEIKKISNRNNVNFIVQEKISGKEFSCILIQNKNEWQAFSPTEIIHKSENYIFNYVDKYMPGASLKITPAKLEDEIINKIKEICIKVAKTISAKGILRVDGFIDKKNEIIIIESNIFPGTSPSSFTFVQAAIDGYSHTTFINKIISEAINNSAIFEKNINFMENEKKDKKKIAVLLGGNNNEKETSLDSGRNIFYKLSPQKYISDAIFLSNENKFFKLTLEQLVKDSTKEINLILKKEQEIEIDELKNYDFVFIGLHGGIGEDGTIQGMLNTLKLPYNGSNIISSSICMDKFKTGQILKENGFNVTEKFIFKTNELKNIENVLKEKNINFPVIIKPVDDGCSYGVFLCNNLEEVKKAINKNFELRKNEILIEEFIDAMEITIGVIGNNNAFAFPPTYTPKKNYILSLEEKFLPGDGENITPAPLEKNEIEFIKKTAEKAYELLECKGYCRIDGFFIPQKKSKTGKDEFKILEFNSLPALTPATCLFHQAAEIGIKPMELIDLIVQLGLEEHANIKYELKNILSENSYRI
jgi:D-alanine--D-alanine ligase